MKSTKIRPHKNYVMTNVRPFFKKTLKTILWLVASIIVLFVILASLIQIPFIQHKLVNTATQYVSNKTHTLVEIKNISISFPKSVVIDGLYLEDLKKDSLIYIGELKVNIAILDLIFNKININSIALEDLNVNLYSTKTDSLFNYNFLITAFSDSTKQDTIQEKKASGWTFNINNVSLKNIQIRYDDEYGGMNVWASLEKLKLKVDELNFSTSIYNIDNLLVEKLNATIQISESKRKQTNKTETILPKIRANNIQINNSTIIYANSLSQQTVSGAIKSFELKHGLVDLEKQLVTLDKIYLSESNIQYHAIESVPDSSVNSYTSLESDWKISVQQMNLNNNSLAYQVGNKPKVKNAFDATNLQYKQVTLTANDFYYSSNLTKVSINKFSAIDQNKFTIKRFETDFRMDKHSITAQKLKINTTKSSIDGDVNIQYASLQSLEKLLPQMIVNINLKKISIQHSDILYFSPQLGKLAFFKNKTNISAISGQIHGRINKLTGKNILIKTGIKTILKTDFTIVGLPNFQSAYFVFPNMTIVSGKQDVEMMLGSSIPASINLPENISLIVNFKGKIKAFESSLAMNSSYGSASAIATIDANENFNGNLNINDFDMGSLLKNKAMYGSASLTAQVNGHGLNPETMTAQIKANVSQIYLNKYLYHNLMIDVTASGREFSGTVNLNDKNVIFDFDGLVNITPNREYYKFHLNVEGVDLQKLNFSKNDVRIGLEASADLTGGTIKDLNGKAVIKNLILTQNGKKYRLDSVLFTAKNEVNKSELKIKSELIDLTYSGTVSPILLPTMLREFINHYFPFSENKQAEKQTKPANFNFEVQMRNHPILSEVLLPQLKEFEPRIISGSFDSQTKVLKVNGSMKRILYGTTAINNLIIDVNSDSTALNYSVSSAGIGNTQIDFENLLFEGKMADKRITANLSSIDNNNNKKLAIQSLITKEKANYRLTLDPRNLYIMNKRWDIAADNYVELGKHGFLIHHFFMNNAQSKVNIASVHNKLNDDLNIEIKNFKLEDISQIIEKESNLVKGDVNGNMLLKRVNNSYGIIADAQIANLFVRNVAVGNLAVKAKNTTNERFYMDVKLSGTENNLTANGYFIPNGGNNSLDIKTDIQSLSMKTVEAFSMGQISQASGNISGNLYAKGQFSKPEITGELLFDSVFVKPKYLNNRIELKHETIQLKTDGIYFNSFTMLDINQHKAVINGTLKMKQFSDFNFALQINTKDFLLFNTSTQDNKVFYGRMIIDSKIDINGSVDLPVVNAKLKMKKGSNFTFAVPEDKLTTDKGENVVELNDTLNSNSILYRTDKKAIKKSSFTGFNLSSIIEVDKEATLKLLMDPTSSDSLVVKGDAALSFIIDRSGKMSLTGAYHINDGSYQISIESLIKRKFKINPGSTIIWNGDPLDADITINANYTVRTSPYDLFSNQLESLSENEKNGYREMYPFIVLLKLRGAILKPEISFEIQLAPEDKGILGGAVNQKLTQLNENPSLLNKQVFALLVLSRFVQENPMQTETNPASNLMRATVGTFLSTQLNQLSSNTLTGVNLNFDIQSYNDYQTGQEQGRTQVEIGVKKQLFNERLSVQLGGAIDVEGEAAKKNSASNIASDIIVEYKLTKNGRYRMKVFRQNQYEGAIDGQLVETGVGVVYVRDFNKWKAFFRSRKNKKETTTKP